MSTPQGWQTPKTNWDSKDPVGVSDLNRMEGNPLAIETGERTLDPEQAPTGNAGTLRQILSWFANRIKAIMGTANWWDAPPVTLKGAKEHIDAKAPHSGHMILGTSNTDINEIKSLGLKIDTRNLVLTYTNGVLVKVEEKDGATAIKTTALTYTDGVLTKVTEVAGGTAVTTTLAYVDGVLSSISRAVS